MRITVPVLAHSLLLLQLSLRLPAAAAPLGELERAAGGALFDPAYEAPAAAPVTPEKLRALMLSDLDRLGGSIEARYAPASWKGQLNGWTLEAALERARAEVAAMNPPSVKDYHRTVKRLFSSLQDYHVSVSFHSTEASVLPFSVAESGGRYYIASVNRKLLPESAFPFKPGDELAALGGVPPARLVSELLARDGINNVPGTDRALAAAQLTVRAGALAGDPQKGPVEISVLPAGAAEPVTVTVNWTYLPELIAPQPFVEKAAGFRLPMAWLADMRMRLPDAGVELAAGNPYAMGDKDGYLPDFGEKIWQAPEGSLFRAYVYKSPGGKKIAYIRIPTYGPADADAAAADFRKLVPELQERSDALVIDQLNNPGGMVFYLYALASSLTDKPLALPAHRVTLTQADAAEAIKFLKETAAITTDEAARAAMGDTVAGYPVSLNLVQGMQGYFREVVKQWNAGKTLSDPMPVYGLAELPPAAGPRYTKPALLLINGLDFSGGDFFPAIMQDNARAVTFGERTAGAGGVVKPYKVENSLLGVSEFNLTATLAQRPGGRPIESLGVEPDIPFAMRPGDLQNGYSAYAAAVNAAAEALVKDPAPLPGQ